MSSRSTAFFVSTLCAVSCLVGDARAEDSSTPVSEQDDAVTLAEDVQKLFADRCLECHGEKEPKGGLRLTSRKNVTARNDSGNAAVVPGQSDDSELIRRVTADDEGRMPPEGDALSSQDVALLRQWINDGTQWSGEKGARTHWSYIPPVRPSLPEREQPIWVRNEIDSFVLKQLESLTPSLSPSPTAESSMLLRRVYLDLIGLPPSVEDVDAFLDDPSSSHYAQIVDRLLASPRYGEKWARSWLDLARYADSNGYQADQFREMWAYRDWIVRALNDDMPFDQFTIEQIAGDLLPDATLDQKIATGFHRCTTCNVEAGVDPEENRVNQIVDRVNTTGTVWLGTTFECAQCHNHKYDPFTQQDYYQLFAFFNNTPLEVKQASDEGVAFDTAGPKMELPLTDAQLQERVTLLQKEETIRGRVAERRRQLNDTLDEWQPTEHVELPKDIRELLTKDVADRTDEDRKRLLEHRLHSDEQFTKLKKRLENVRQRLAAASPDTTLVMIEQDEPRMTSIFKRGDFLQPGAAVERATPAVLHPFQQIPNNGAAIDRLTLAEWLVSEENPLVARVTVNRWWAEIFGRGLVETVEDFGVQGERPTHPKLLDWLAVEFMQNGWSMKHIHQIIVTSATYRQDSRVSSAHLEQDPANQWLARGPRIRLPAESIRDNALAVSGLLSGRMGGPPVYPPQPPHVWRHTGRNPPKYETDTDEDRYRRGLYVVWRRSAAYPSFVNFDAPDRAACSVKRSTTNTPLQALTLLNDPAYVEMSIALARRIENDLVEATDRERVEYGFRRTIARQPTSDEVNILLGLFESERERLCRDPVETTDPVSCDAQEKPLAPRAAAWIFVANALLNLDETITKE